MLCVGTRAATVQVIDGLKYIIYTDQNCATLINNNYTQSEIVIPAKIAWEGKKYPVTELGAKCFSNCHSLTSITIPSSVTSLGDECFFWCDGLKSVTIPSSVISLGESCFRYCKSLTSITIPSSVTSLGDNCFSNCSGLTSITIPSSVTILGDECFNCCSSLTSINIQSPNIKIGSGCFALTMITDFTIMATTPPAISGECFEDCNIDKAKLVVPKASVNSYRSAAVWKTFGTITDTDGREVAGECDKPSIGYTGGKLKFGCQTPGAKYHYTIKAADACTDVLAEDEVSLAARYDISCYATAEGYTRSKTATAKLYWISANMQTDGIAPATQMRGVVVSAEGGIVTLSGLQENERVTFYNVSGMKLGETRALNGQASISAPDEVIIARIGTQSIKVRQ